MRFCRDWNADILAFSAVWFRDTVISTMLPDVIFLGKRTEGNSIYNKRLVKKAIRPDTRTQYI